MNVYGYALPEARADDRLIQLSEVTFAVSSARDLDSLIDFLSAAKSRMDRGELALGAHMHLSHYKGLRRSGVPGADVIVQVVPQEGKGKGTS